MRATLYRSSTFILLGSIAPNLVPGIVNKPDQPYEEHPAALPVEAGQGQEDTRTEDALQAGLEEVRGRSGGVQVYDRAWHLGWIPARKPVRQAGLD